MFTTVLDMRMAGAIADLVDDGKVKPVVAAEFKMEQALEV